MQSYASYRPTQFDAAGAFLPDRQDWLVLPCGTNRDADALTRANWESAVEMLGAVDPEGEDHEEHSFGHWGPGWFALILVRPGSKAAGVAEEIERAIENYPVLDDEKLSAIEWDDAERHWRALPIKDRIHEIGLHNQMPCRYCGWGTDDAVSIFAARREEPPDWFTYHSRD